MCTSAWGPLIRGSRFECLDCIDSDFCSDCYVTWENSNGEMEVCKGHKFYQIPRSCWYGFKDNQIMVDGSTMEQVMSYLEKRFTELLEGLDGTR